MARPTACRGPAPSAPGKPPGRPGPPTPPGAPFTPSKKGKATAENHTPPKSRFPPFFFKITRPPPTLTLFPTPPFSSCPQQTGSVMFKKPPPNRGPPGRVTPGDAPPAGGRGPALPDGGNPEGRPAPRHAVGRAMHAI